MTEKQELTKMQRLLLLIANAGLDHPATMNYILNNPEEWQEFKEMPRIKQIIDKEVKEEANALAISQADVNNFHTDSSKLIYPADVDSFRIASSKLTNSLIRSPFNEVVGTEYGVDVASNRDKKDNKSVITYFRILENPNIRLPEHFEFTEKTARYIDAIGSALEDPSVRENGGAIKARHLINIMNGKNASNVRKEEIDRVLHDLDILSSINVYIDAQEHAEYNNNNKNKNKIATPEYRDYLLATGMRSGADGEKYILIKQVPPLYQYAKELGQIMTYNKHDLDLTRIYITDETGKIVDEKKTAIKHQTERINNIQGLFIRKEISALNQLKKNAKKGSKPYIELTYKYIYDYLLSQEPTLNIEHRKSDINKQIYNVLDVLKGKGLIDDFDADISRGRIRKYKIRLF